MHAVLPALPEFHDFRSDAVAAPSWGHRDLVLVGEATRHLGELVIELGARTDRARLLRGPRTQLRAPGAHGPIREYLLGADLADWALYVCLAT
ncbi:Uncharacterised protein [Mycobacterium tuberculosis]|nr:Uncharacterised protein [Mycobacterium tuberculosis]